MHTVPLFRNIKGETSSESLSRRFPGVTSLPSQPTSVLQALIPAHWWARHISLSSPVFVIKTSGWKAPKDHTCLMKIFWGLRKSKNLPKKTPNSPMYLSTEPPCQCQVYKNTWYKKAPFSVFLLHRRTTCTTPQNTPWVFSAILVSAIFYRTLPAMKCYEIATRPFLADCICIMFEDHPIFYVLPKDLSVETPHFCQALHAPFVASVGLRVAASPSELLS